MPPLRPEVQVFSPENGLLQAYPDATRAIAACDPARVRAQTWLFFAADGSPLRPEFMADSYYLRPWASCASCTLAQVLHAVQEVQGNPPFDSVEAILRQLP